MAGQFFEISAETGRIGKAEGDGYFSHALGAGTEKILGLRDSSVDRPGKYLTPIKRKKARLSLEGLAFDIMMVGTA